MRKYFSKDLLFGSNIMKMLCSLYIQQMHISSWLWVLVRLFGNNG